MKNFEFKKSTRYIIFLLIFISGGCYNLREFSKSTISQSGGYYFIVHTSDSCLLIKNATFYDSVFSGMIIDESITPDKLKTIHLYVAPDNAVIKDGNLISIPFNNIAKAEGLKLNGLKTIELIVLGGIAAGTLIFLIALVIGGGYDM